MNAIADAVTKAGEQILNANEKTFELELVTALSQLVGWPFSVGAGVIIDNEGHSAGPVSAIVYQTKTPGHDPKQQINADSVAAAIDACDTLTPFVPHCRVQQDRKRFSKPHAASR